MICSCRYQVSSNGEASVLHDKCPNAKWFLVRVQSEYRKIQNRINSVFGHFSRSGDDDILPIISFFLKKRYLSVKFVIFSKYKLLFWSISVIEYENCIWLVNHVIIGSKNVLIVSTLNMYTEQSRCNLLSNLTHLLIVINLDWINLDLD